AGCRRRSPPSWRISSRRRRGKRRPGGRRRKTGQQRGRNVGSCQALPNGDDGRHRAFEVRGGNVLSEGAGEPCSPAGGEGRAAASAIRARKHRGQGVIRLARGADTPSRDGGKSAEARLPGGRAGRNLCAEFAGEATSGTRDGEHERVPKTPI